MYVADKTLLKRVVLHNESEAFHELYKRYAKALFSFFSKRIGDSDNAEDLVHDLFVELWNNAGEIEVKSDGNLKKWFFSRARSLVSGYLKKERRLVRLDGLSPEEHSEFVSASDILEEFTYNELKELIDAAVKSLPIHLQKVYQLRVQYRYSVEDTSRMLSLTPQTVYKKYSESLSHVRKKLEEARPELVQSFVKESKSKSLSLRSFLFFF